MRRAGNVKKTGTGKSKSATAPLRVVALLCLCVLVCLAPPSRAAVRAADTRPTGKAAETVACGLLSDGLRNSRAEIDLRAACLPREALGRVFARVMNGTPELFYVDSRLSYTYDAAGDVLSVTPAYRMAGEELEAARRFWHDTLDQVMASLHEAQTARQAVPGGGIPAWSEADTVLFLHEYLAQTYDYDTAGGNFDALSLFRDGVGVCQAYALAFMALGRAAGLEVDMVTSREMDHAWNHVRVGDAWYHVDVTRDDPIREPGTASVVRHTRLLRSDAGMEAEGYTAFSCGDGHICADGRYETAEGDAWFSGVDTPLTCLPTGWFRAGEDADSGLWIPCAFPPAGGTSALPCAACAACARCAGGMPGDMDGDGRLSPADLLWLDICPLPQGTAGRAALRERILRDCGR